MSYYPPAGPPGYPPQGQGYYPPPTGYPPQQGYPPSGYPPQGYPPVGYPPQAYPHHGHHAHPPPCPYPHHHSPMSGAVSGMVNVAGHMLAGKMMGHHHGRKMKFKRHGHGPVGGYGYGPAFGHRGRKMKFKHGKFKR